jgi:hypothetical protein
MSMATVAFAQKVTTDHASGVNLSQYKTFQWIKEPKTSNPLVKERVIADVNSALESHGLKLVESDGDLAVAAHAATTQERTLETFYDGFPGGWRWNSGFGTATTSVRTYEVGTLVIDLFDAHTKEAVWRGTSTKTLSGAPRRHPLPRYFLMQCAAPRFAANG